MCHVFPSNVQAADGSGEPMSQVIMSTGATLDHTTRGGPWMLTIATKEAGVRQGGKTNSMCTEMLTGEMHHWSRHATTGNPMNDNPKVPSSRQTCAHTHTCTKLVQMQSPVFLPSKPQFAVVVA